MSGSPERSDGPQPPRSVRCRVIARPDGSFDIAVMLSVGEVEWRPGLATQSEVVAALDHLRVLMDACDVRLVELDAPSKP